MLNANRAWEAKRKRPSVLTRHLEEVLAHWDDDADGRAALRAWQQA